MADDTSDWVKVDDRDPGITYSTPSGGYTLSGGVSQEYNQTTTGLAVSGDIATYYFNASRIGVFGTYGPTGNSGSPIAVFQVDNTPAATLTAPFTQVTLYRQNFWTSDPQLPSLAPGAFHVLVVNATLVPNNTAVFIDYLAYPPTDASTATTSSSSTSTFSSTFSTSSATSTGVQPTFTASNVKTNVGTMIAGVVVGAVALILAVVALIYMHRRRSRPTSAVGEHLIQRGNDASSNTSYNHHTSLTHPVAPYSPHSETYAPSYLSAPQQDGARDQFPGSLRSPEAVRTFDGGVSLMGGPPQVPPEYQEQYESSARRI